MLRTHGDVSYKQEQRFHLELGLLKLVHAQRLLPLEQLLSESNLSGRRQKRHCHIALARARGPVENPGTISAGNSAGNYCPMTGPSARLPSSSTAPAEAPAENRR